MQPTLLHMSMSFDLVKQPEQVIESQHFFPSADSVSHSSTQLSVCRFNFTRTIKILFVVVVVEKWSRTFRAYTHKPITWSVGKRFPPPFVAYANINHILLTRFYSNMKCSNAIIFAVKWSFALQTSRHGIHVHKTKDKEIARKPFKSYLIGAIISSSNEVPRVWTNE